MDLLASGAPVNRSQIGVDDVDSLEDQIKEQLVGDYDENYTDFETEAERTKLPDIHGNGIKIQEQSQITDSMADNQVTDYT